MIIIEKIFDVQSGQETIVEREANDVEQAERENAELRFAEKVAAEAERVAKRHAVLEKLGLTEEEANAILN